MNGKRIGGVTCLILAGVGTLRAISNLGNTALGGAGASYAIGGLVVPVLLLIAGVWLLRNSSK